MDSPELINLEKLFKQARENDAADLILTVGAPPRAKRSYGLIGLSEDVVTPDFMNVLVENLVPDRLRQELFDEGSVDFSYTTETGRIRFNVFRQKGEYSLVGRMIATEIPSLYYLGIPDIIHDIIKRRMGLIIVNGSTGSGKTTTLAAIIDELNANEDLHIISIEDPIEFAHENKKSTVEQIEVGVDTPSYSATMRRNLRRAADVIIVGEMRDPESIEQALMLAETGHLVISTLHSDDGVTAISRIADVFPSDKQEQIFYLLSKVLLCIMTQALLPSKKEEGGLVLATEVLMATPGIKNLIAARRPEQIYSAMQSAGEAGMCALNDCLEQFVIEGELDEEDALHRSTQPKWLQRRIDEFYESEGSKKSSLFGRKKK